MIIIIFIINYALMCYMSRNSARNTTYSPAKGGLAVIAYSVASARLFFFQCLTINSQKETVFYFKGYYHMHSGTLLRCAYGGVFL